MELTPRLQKIAQLVPRGARFADIGTDHGYLPVWLILNGVIESAIAADLRKGPLERARDTAKKYNVSEKMDLRLCDGLADVKPDEADCIAIAGMGGETIAHILSCAPWAKEEGITLLLQPMSSQSDLRQWLGTNGFIIDQEYVVREDKTLYTIFVAKAGVMPNLSPAEVYAGRQSKDSMRGEYLDHLITKVTRALEGQRSATQKDESSIAELTRILAGMKAMREEWSTWQR